jgi:Rrf2 family nitric oxide-sensitive transcriptional repressor
MFNMALTTTPYLYILNILIQEIHLLKYDLYQGREKMRLNKKTDYCLRVLIYLQKNPGKAKIQNIADAYNISKNHLSVAVNKLSEVGYILSTQGPKGGIEFNPKTADRSVGEVIKNIESLAIVECFEGNEQSCSLNPHCKLKRMLKKAMDSFIAELHSYKIKDLI